MAAQAESRGATLPISNHLVRPACETLKRNGVLDFFPLSRNIQIFNLETNKTKLRKVCFDFLKLFSVRILCSWPGLMTREHFHI